MEWRDQGVVVAVRPHAETSAIIEVLTAEHGRHAGVVRGGVSRKMTPVLQPGNQVEVEWRARLEEHLGSYRVELLHSRSAVLADRQALAALGSVCALVCFAFPERMNLPDLYERTLVLVGDLATGRDWLQSYALWELAVLQDLGYGLDLSSCAATGRTQDLIYVSPKTGRAVSREGGADWADRLLPLPVFLRVGEGMTDMDDICAALKTTGFFLENGLAKALGNRPLPAARERFVAMLRRAAQRKSNTL
ncbi:MAG: DNA repair protein RecO [Rhodobacteraceae bacterium]|nr:DNA repair protein RecO [Paracoccaceae bacterium]